MKKNYCQFFNLLKIQSGVFLKTLSVVIIMFMASEVLGVGNSISLILLDTLITSEQDLLVKNNEPTSLTVESHELKGTNESVTGTPKQLPVNEKGFLVTVASSNDKFKHVVTKDPTRVTGIFEVYFGTDLDVLKILNHSPYFDMKTDDIYFYAEVGTIKTGKNGKLKFKRMKKTRK